MPPLVSDLIQAARIRHWSFTDVELGDGAALMFLNQRQRTHLAAHGAAIEGIVGGTTEYSLGTNTTGALVALVNRVPTYSTGVADGFPVHLSGNGVPYIDTSEAPIARDPFGASGGTPGFPLPPDLVRLINVALIYTNNQIIPCDLISERERHDHPPGRNAAAFISGNRIVPVLPLSTGNAGNRWLNVLAIQISAVVIQTLTTLADVVTLPSVLCEALTADIALLLARQSQTCDKADKAGFDRDASQAAAAVRDAGLDMLDSVVSSSILFRP